MADVTQVIDSSVNGLAPGDCLRHSEESFIARFRVVMLIGSGLALASAATSWLVIRDKAYGHCAASTSGVHTGF